MKPSDLEPERSLAAAVAARRPRTTRDAIWEWEPNTGATWWSDAMHDTFGFERGVAPSLETWSARIHPEDRDRVMSELAAAVTRGDVTWSDEYRITTPVAGVRHVFDRGFLVTATDGRPPRMFGVMVDVTAASTLDRRALRLAHDLNNALQSVTLATRQLARHPEQHAEHLAAIQAAVAHAGELTRALGALAKRGAER